MKTTALLVSLTLLAAATPVKAEPPPELVQLLLAQAKGGPAVVHHPSMTPEQTAFFNKDRVRKDGYFEFAVPPAYLDTVSVTQKMMNRKPTDAIEVLAVKTQNLGFQYLGQFVEDKYRTNLLFSDRGKQVMLTTWNFVAQGARIVGFEEHRNVTLGPAKGNLTLVKAAGNPQVFWVLNWILRDQFQIELWVEDRLNENGEPTLRPEHILGLARTLLP